MTLLDEVTHAGEFIVSEAKGLRSREAVTIASGQNLAAGAVLGHITCGATSTAADGGNTGDGALSAVTLSGGGAMPGDYILTITAAETDAGDYQVIAPDGNLIGVGSVGGEFNFGGLLFTLSDGVIDFIVGDRFTITVAEIDQYAEHDPDGVDGREVAAGILFDAVDASAADQSGVALVRDAEINSNEIVWKTGISADAKTTGIEAMNDDGIILR
ncbi:head decoration protein [Methylomarinum sp. Ch1-1]|uniref:Head decoration protein n=1 Tax=Methylomarinum roseum TaxID=3067653 RepID=A0AAU7NPB1_9GAMM|nr:head decoration protein [Methylomarinum sp. Ch1-1]MDP4521311.1 head decoration protein [Methylomarinum sp. Ch1-1]